MLSTATNSLSRHISEKKDGSLEVTTLDINADWKKTFLMACEIMLLTKMLMDEIFPPDNEDWNGPLHARVLAASDALA